MIAGVCTNCNRSPEFGGENGLIWLMERDRLTIVLVFCGDLASKALMMAQAEGEMPGRKQPGSAIYLLPTSQEMPLKKEESGLFVEFSRGDHP
jgi:hypothetical protein